jgi:multiple sugar transport system substrate-binding protein
MKRKRSVHAALQRTIVSVLVACLAVAAAGCSSDQPAAEPARPLKVFMDDYAFHNEYRDYFDAVFPGLPVEPVWTTMPDNEFYQLPDRDAELLKVIETEKPDLIFTNDPSFYRRLADEGRLVELSGWFESSGLSEEDYHPGMIATMRHNERGGLYGLSPAFNATVLYYNLDLFKRFGIELPQDGMTWEEVLRLAHRFKTGTVDSAGIVGFHQMYAEQPLNYILTIARTEGLSMLDPASGTVTVDTPAWRSVFKQVLELYEQETLITQVVGTDNEEGVRMIGPEDQKNADLFRQGKAAMQVEYYPSYADVPFEWSAVSPPVSSADRTRSADLYFYPVIGVYAGSEQQEQALEVMRYFASERLAKTKANLMDVEFGQGKLSSHRATVELQGDPIIEGIYRQLPALPPGRDYVRADRALYEQFDVLLARELERVMADETTVEEALRTIQAEGQALMDAASESSDDVSVDSQPADE